MIIGAGPVGLYQAFQLGLLGFTARIVDVLPHAGGQCIELYPDTPIYDIPALPRCTGRELVQNLLQQVLPFGFELHLNELISALTQGPQGNWQIVAQSGHQWSAKAVFITAGVGAFLPRALQAEGADLAQGHGLAYRLDDPVRFAGQQVLVIGGDDLALSWLLQLAEAPPSQRPSSLTLLHRRDVLTADATRQQRFQTLCAQGLAQWVVGQPTRIVCDASSRNVCAVQVSPPQGDPFTLGCTHVLAATGISPRLGPLAHWGLDLHHKQLAIDPATGATAVPGIYAAGDLVTYPGKKKLIACGFHEAVMAAFGAADALRPGQNGSLQYTTSSTLLQQRLGVR